MRVIKGDRVRIVCLFEGRNSVCGSFAKKRLVLDRLVVVGEILKLRPLLLETIEVL